MIPHELVMFGFPTASDAMKSLSGPKELRGAEAGASHDEDTAQATSLHLT